MSGDPADTGRALFVLAEALRGRAPGGPPPPRVLDLLLFGRAQARFLASAAVAAGAVDAMPWRELDLEAAPPEPRQAVDTEHGTQGDLSAHGPRARPAPSQEPTAALHRTPAEDVGGSAVRRSAAASSSAVEGADGPPPTLRFRQPAVPAAPAPPAGAPRREPPSAEPDAPQPRALPFARPPAVPWTIAAEGEQTVGAPGRAAAGRAVAAQRPASPDARDAVASAAPAALRPAPLLPDLPWATPALPEGQPAATAHRAAGPFAASPARSAAELAERVARAVVGPDPPDRQPAVPAADGGGATRTTRATAELPRVQPPSSGPPLTVSGLLREVTRDEVVRALAARMRALARDDRFRLGELR